jgi:UDP-N-acetylmuramyl pentapeptide phosphotransferase/UDP-N-acetylglucosamine-1-phosphate transferase
VLPFLFSFFAAFAVAGAIVVLSGRGGMLALDVDQSGPQKFHVRPVPRIGGVAIMAATAGAVLLLRWLDPAAFTLGGLLLLCGLPAFGAGLIEDLTRAVPPSRRLLATAVSAALAFALLDARIERADVPGLDFVLAFGAGAWFVTIFTVAGIANSVNIIDGFNGLASMCAVIMMTALTYVAYQVGDTPVGVLGLVGIGAVLGFFVFNFPAGLIFLGDGGAYFLGFFVAELSILLIARNPDVSPMFPLLVCIYPVFETLFSIYRRKFLRAVPPSMPDGIHLHSLIYRRLLRWAVGDRSAKALTRRNSMTSPYLWLLCMFSVVPAVLFWNDTRLMILFIVVFGASYVILYWRIVRFKSPWWMKFSTGRDRLLAKADNRRL